MASMNPIIRIRKAFRSIGVEEEQADEVAEALTDHSFSRPETELMFQREMARFNQRLAELQQQMAEFKTQVILALFVAAGLIITAMGLMIAFLD